MNKETKAALIEIDMRIAALIVQKALITGIQSAPEYPSGGFVQERGPETIVEKHGYIRKAIKEV